MESQRRPSVVAHCDWSKDPKKRWLAAAVRDAQQWSVQHPEPVGNVTDLLERLRTRASSAGPIMVGFDFPIGLPERYGELTRFPDFKGALSAFGQGEWARWFDVCDDRQDISVKRPFYPMRPGGRKRDHLTQALGLGYNELLRRCERATDIRSAACCLFWTLGGNQVGKGAITGWREVIMPNLDRVGLWPFDGALDQLLATHDVILAETYPGDVYGQIGLPAKSGWTKTKPTGRVIVAPHLIQWIESRRVHADNDLEGFIRAGFSPRSIGEDQFDAFVGLLGMLDVVDGRMGEGGTDDPVAMRWEGWILGQSTV